jgi:hypothetical protein
MTALFDLGLAGGGVALAAGAVLAVAGALAGRLGGGAGRWCWLVAGRLPPGGDGEWGPGRRVQAKAARSRWKPSAIWAAHRQVRSMRRRTWRAERVSWAATCRTR